MEAGEVATLIFERKPCERAVDPQGGWSATAVAFLFCRRELGCRVHWGLFDLRFQHPRLLEVPEN